MQIGPTARGKYTPSAYGTSPGGGGLLYTSLSANLSCSLSKGWKTSPSGVHSEHILHYANWICREATATRKSSESVTAEDEGASATRKM